MNLFKIYRAGLLYMSKCSKQLNDYGTFPEVALQKLFKLVKFWMPPFVIIIYSFYYLFHTELMITIVCTVFAISMPIQIVFWFGFRAQSPLPLNLISWYHYLVNKLKEREQISPNFTIETVPTYFDLMTKLQKAECILTKKEIIMEEQNYD